MDQVLLLLFTSEEELVCEVRNPGVVVFLQLVHYAPWLHIEMINIWGVVSEYHEQLGLLELYELSDVLLSEEYFRNCLDAERPSFFIMLYVNYLDSRVTA